MGINNCKFCMILSGSLPAAVVLEDQFCMAFLDTRPLFHGHCLLVPRTHCETLPDLPDALLAPFFSDVKLLCCAVQEAMGAEGTFVAINNTISQSVPHLHAHIVPRNRKDGLKGFFWPRRPYRDQRHMNETAERIREAVERLRSGGG
jgi:histidine triad (HIT) family protein